MDEKSAESTHDLLLALAGRVDDDLLVWARELVAVGELQHAIELITANLVADRTALPEPTRSSLVAATRSAGTELDAEQALLPARSTDLGPEHRFDSVAGELVVGAVQALPARLLVGCRVLLARRLTPAGGAPGPVPHPVLLVEVSPGARNRDVLAYQLADALDRAGVRTSVEVISTDAGLPAYHAEALRHAVAVRPGGPAGPDGERSGGPDEPAGRPAVPARSDPEVQPEREPEPLRAASRLADELTGSARVEPSGTPPVLATGAPADQPQPQLGGIVAADQQEPELGGTTPAEHPEPFLSPTTPVSRPEPFLGAAADSASNPGEPGYPAAPADGDGPGAETRPVETRPVEHRPGPRPIPADRAPRPTAARRDNTSGNVRPLVPAADPPTGQPPNADRPESGEQPALAELPQRRPPAGQPDHELFDSGDQLFPPTERRHRNLIERPEREQAAPRAETGNTEPLAVRRPTDQRPAGGLAPTSGAPADPDPDADPDADELPGESSPTDLGLRPESVARLSASGRELLARLQAELQGAPHPLSQRAGGNGTGPQAKLDPPNLAG